MQNRTAGSSAAFCSGRPDLSNTKYEYCGKQSLLEFLIEFQDSQDCLCLFLSF